MILIYRNTILLNTKNNYPQPGNDIIERAELACKLGSFSDYRLILMTAPAGYGKTSFLASWADKANASLEEGKPLICWFSVEEEENRQTAFFDYLFNAFYHHSGLPDSIKTEAERMFGGCASFNRQHLIYFINDASNLKRDILIIFDDIHLIDNPGIFRELSFLLEHMPENLHILLSGRAAPAMELGKWKMYGKVLECSGRELAFTGEETAALCRRHFGANCPAGRIRSIHDRSEGWPAGVSLLLACRELPEEAWRQSKASAEETGTLLTGRRNRILYDYLMEEVFRKLPEETKRFLVATSIPDYFTAPLCNALLETEDCGPILTGIRNENLFLSYCGQGQGQYRYHKMFREFLLRQFSMLGEDARQSLYQRLLQWYEKENRWDRAIDYAIKIQEYDKAAGYIEQVSGELGRRGQAGILQKWNRLLPRETVEGNPRLLLNSAWAAAGEGRQQKVLQYLSRMSAFPVTDKMRAEMAALYSSNLSPLAGNLDAAVRVCGELLRVLDAEDFLAQLLCFHMATAYLYQGKLAESIVMYEKCRRDSAAEGNSYLCIIANRALVRFLLQKGQLQRAKRESEALLADLEEGGKGILPAAGLVYAGLAEIYLELGRTEEARRMAREGLKLGRFGENAWAGAENLLILARLYGENGQLTEQREAIKELAGSIQNRELFDVEIRLGSYLTDKQLNEGDTRPAAAWLARQDYIADGELAAVYPEILLLKSRMARQEKRDGMAEAYLVRCEEIADRFGLNRVRQHCGALRQGFESGGGLGRDGILSVREREIMKLVRQGASNAEIAEALFISVNTVKTHLLHIYDKFKVHSRSRAALMAERSRQI